MRTSVGIAATVAALGLAAGATVAFVLYRSIPPLDATERVMGLGASVEVRWDGVGIPHLAARSDRDAFAALGYLHARDRLWEMDLLRRTAEGRLAEILGPAAVDVDRFLRTLDIPRAASRSRALLPPEVRGLAQAYARGVNAWIDDRGRPLGPEFMVLRYRPGHWSEQAIFEIARLMAWDLVNAGGELSLARAAARIGGERVGELFPAYPDSAPVILPRGSGRWAPRAAGGTRAGPGAGAGAGADAPARQRAGRWPALPSALLASRDVPAIPPLAATLLDAAASARASNSWVIGPARTRSGKPILANDPHLALRAPALWYLAAIESPGFHVVGATIPGIPAIILGHNRSIAWGLTNVGVDDVDYVIERLSDDSSRVETPSGWQPLEVIHDSIRVRGRAAVPFTLRRGPHGALAGRAPGGDPRTALAMRWNAQDPSDELTALLGVDRAASWGEFRVALRGFRVPEQNWVYADVDGNIGYQMTGAVPVRRSGNGLLPTPGWTDEGRWERYLDFEELPWAVNPREGFIVTANNRVVGPEYPGFITASWEMPYRAARIRELIQDGGPLTAAAVRRMQMDTLDVFARWAKDLAARAARRVGRPDLARALAKWDGTMGSDRVEPSLFWTWYRAVQRLTYEDELPDGYAPGNPLHRWLRAGGSPWFDDVRTPQREDLDAVSDRAMREAVSQADSVRWGAMHVTLSAHALGSVRILDRLLGLNIGPSPRAGSLYTVDVADFGSLRPPFLNIHAASFRQVVDLADLAHAGMVITTGQSGNPLSRRYRDQVSWWWRGDLRVVPLDGSALRPAGRLVLEPRR